MEHDPVAKYKTILEQRDIISVSRDGWVTSPSGDRLLFWVPPEFRERLLMPGQQLLLGVEPLELDLSRFVHGPDWMNCYQS